MSVREIFLNSFQDERGVLTAGQFPDQLPFVPSRFFVISDVPVGHKRGEHAHKSNQQIFVCLSGGLRARFNDGDSWQDFKMSPGDECLFVPALHFGELSEFEQGTKLLVLASEVYNPEEYIHDFVEFTRFLESSPKSG